MERDILQARVRVTPNGRLWFAGLKEYSKWPTYPQLYVRGELLGGLDIVKELDQGGELADQLPVRKDLNSRYEPLVAEL